MDNTFETHLDVKIEDEMKKSYLDYAMSVIVGRALPDVRDGLKPVHRRILYAMYQMGITHDKPYKKSARIVGEVLGKYHPHGDTASYEALVRMAQDFSYRYPLIDGHGNFGSVDGDAPAAMRYTEVRLAQIAEELLRDIEKETVDFVPNFDGSLKEPVVLPARIPNLLINGSSGIAVGMATNIPPHNLREVIDGIVATIDNPEITIDELIGYIKGPDFPTGAYIVGTSDIREAYETGRGKLKVRAKTEIERSESGKTSIIITEIPYQVNKSLLLENIAKLVQNKVISNITDLRDESDREGMRIVVELRRGTNPQVVLNQLYKHTQLETTFGVISIALVDGQPKTLSLKSLIEEFVKHRKEVVRRRTEFELKKAKEKAHILEGLKIALDHLDEVIALIRRSKSPKEAKEGLMSNFGLTDIQAQAILDLRLQRLTALEREKIEKDYEETLKLIARLEEILASETKISEIIKEELMEIKKKYGDERRTKIIEDDGSSNLNIEDLIHEEDVVISFTDDGYIKRIPLRAYRSQKRGGTGSSGVGKHKKDFVKDVFVCSTHDRLLFFTNKGKVYSTMAYEIPEGRKETRGTYVANVVFLDDDETLTSVIPIAKSSQNTLFEKYLVMGTKRGIIKKVKVEEFRNIRSNGIRAMNIREDDELVSVVLVDNLNKVIFITRGGMSLHMAVSELRDLGRTAMGVIGIRLNPDDEVITLLKTEEDKDILVVTEDGYGKRTSVTEYRVQGRGGKGIATIVKRVDIAGALIVDEKDDVILVTKNGTVIRFKVSDIRSMGRVTKGVRLIKLRGQDRVVAIAKIDRD